MTKPMLVREGGLNFWSGQRPFHHLKWSDETGRQTESKRSKGKERYGWRDIADKYCFRISEAWPIPLTDTDTYSSDLIWPCVI